MRDVIASIESEYRRYRRLAEGAFEQLTDEDLADPRGDGNNSVATIAWHIAGNLRSRFTDFLTTDGEKPWRDRESEFLERRVARAALLAFWSEGWGILTSALGDLSDADLSRTVTIRDQALTVLEALQRSVTHTSYHVGQIVYIAKALRGPSWKSLSIPPGQSASYRANPKLDRP